MILNNLIHNTEYTKRVIPYINEKYFRYEYDKVIFDVINKYVNEYNCNPSIPALKVLLNEVKMNEAVKEGIDSRMGDLLSPINENLLWLVNTTETFCKDRAIENAIHDSVEILQSGKERNAISDLLQKALAVCFDTSIGHDYLDDYNDRYLSYRSDVAKLPFDIDYLNKITGGGLLPKTLNVLMAGCVHPHTKVNLKVNNEIFDCPFEYIDKYLKDGLEVYINSPDGYVRVSKYIIKGSFEKYQLNLDDGRFVICNEDHLFETALGWHTASDIYFMQQEFSFLTDSGYVKGVVNKSEGEHVPIVDLVVEHENHRYYANGISSHNTGVGKSMVMCHLAASYLMQSKNVLYITLEMSEMKIAERIDANLFDVNINSLPTLSQDAFNNKIERIHKKTKGDLVIKEYPTSTHNCSHFEALIDELRLKRDFVPDVIFVDYINICTSSRFSSSSTNSYQYIKSISEELRAMGVKHSVPVISATQTNRCLDLNTIVRIKDRGLMPIKNCEVGMKVHSYGNNFYEIKEIHPITKQKVYKIKTCNDRIIVSANHIFPLLYGHQLSIDTGLKVGDVLISCSWDDSKRTFTEYLSAIESITELDERDTIDITIDGNHLFYANNILTHNSGYTSSDPGMEDTSESFALNFVADLALVLISSPELKKMNQIVFKQLKNRYNDPSLYHKFVVGVDSSKMRLYDCESQASRDLIENKEIEEVNDELFQFKISKSSKDFSSLKT